MNVPDVKGLLDRQVIRFNSPAFIADDPISLPHRFSKLQDIEIIGFWVAMLSWGQRKTIVNKGHELVRLMDGAPHDFVVNHEEKDRSAFLGFKHRTFQPTDTLYFLEFFQQYYQQHTSLETAFSHHLSKQDDHVENALTGFHRLFFGLPDPPARTTKHVPTPEKKSTCKRLNMFLRWMVRRDNLGVDFGLWQSIRPDQLIVPLDLHVEKVARKLNLLTRQQVDWQAALELTRQLKEFDPHDPVKYDFALFGMGVGGME